MPQTKVRAIKGQPDFTLRVALPGGNDGRLRLVRADREDAALLAKWRTDHYDEFFTRIRPGAEEVLDWLEGYETDDRDMMFVLEYPDGVPVGQMALSKIDLDEKSAEFGRIIRGERKAPHGIMQIASRTLIAWAFGSLNLEQIYLQVFARNHQARRLYAELGFRLSEIQYLQRTVSSKGVEQYVPGENQGTEDGSVERRSAHKMILEKKQEGILIPG